MSQLPHSNIITLHYIQHFNKRDRLVNRINTSKGSTKSLVEKDQFWLSGKTLSNLLAPFKDHNVGLPGGLIK
jgi:hypothetical protein